MSMLSRLVGFEGLDIKRRGAWLVVGGILATIFAGLAVAALSLAGFFILSEHLTAVEAALVVAAVALVILVLIVWLTIRMVRRAQTDIAGAVRASAVVSLAPAAVSLVSRNVSVAGMIALVVAGLAYLEGRRRG